METTSLDSQTPFEPDYIEQPIILQLMKVVDSFGNPKPLTHVRTDDGDEVLVTHEQASTLVDLFRTLDTTTKYDTVWEPEKGAFMFHWKRKFLADIQRTEGLKDALTKVVEMYK